jgi:hypothetical protein
MHATPTRPRASSSAPPRLTACLGPARSWYAWPVQPSARQLMKSSALVLALATTACPAPALSPPRSLPARSTSRPSATSRPLPPASAPARWTLLWGRVRASKSCFFFIGPPGSGARRIHGGALRVSLPRRGTVELQLGQARFVGRRSGRLLVLKRSSQHRHKGRWRVTEQLQLERGDAGWRGRYHYAECDQSGKEGCPGRCEIRARVSLDRAP